MMRPLALLLFAPMGVWADVIDFETADVGAPPAEWMVAMTNEGAPPRWLIADDPSAPSGPKVLAQLSDDGTPDRFPLAIYEGIEAADGEISVRFKPVSGRVDRAAGLVWRYRNEENYYLARANALENNVVLYKVENGRRTALSPRGRSGDYGVRHTVPSGRWSTLGVSFTGQRFTVSFDGQELFEVSDSTFTDGGKVGLWTKADSVSFFDDFEVAVP